MGWPGGGQQQGVGLEGGGVVGLATIWPLLLIPVADWISSGDRPGSGC